MQAADFKHHEIEGAKALADFLILGGEAAVAAEKDRVAWRANDERGPERAVPPLDRATREVLRRRGAHPDAAFRELVRLPPVELGDARRRDAPGLEMRADAKRSHERHVERRQLADRRIVEVIVVVVRDDHEIERWQRVQRDRHGLEALRAREPRRRGAQPPDRIGEHAQAVDLDQHRRMTEPGGAQTAAGFSAPGFERIHRRQRCLRHAALAAAEKLGDGRHRHLRIAQPRQDRVQVAKALARPARRRLDALEPSALRFCAERLHGCVGRVAPADPVYFTCNKPMQSAPCRRRSRIRRR